MGSVSTALLSPLPLPQAPFGGPGRRPSRSPRGVARRCRCNTAESPAPVGIRGASRSQRPGPTAPRPLPPVRHPRQVQTFPFSSPGQSFLFFHSEGTHGVSAPGTLIHPRSRPWDWPARPCFPLGTPCFGARTPHPSASLRPLSLQGTELAAYSSLTTGVFMSYSEK